MGNEINAERCPAMTADQVALARHALGLDGRRTMSYRNHFVAGEEHSDFPEWQKMVGDGNAMRHTPRQFGGQHCFNLTLQGARLALLPGETLDREDFPADSAKGATAKSVTK